MIKCIVVDDDILSRKIAEECIKKTEYLDLKESFSNAIDAIKYLKSNKIDLIFLDVEMPEISGLEMLEQLKTVPQIVLITSKRDYAVEAFEYDVTDYIVKPFDYERFKKAALKAKQNHEAEQALSSDEDDFFVKKDGKLIKLNLSEIIYVEALADYVNIHLSKTTVTSTERLTVLSTMKSVEAKLPVKDFARVHRSYIVRLDKIKSLVENNLIIADKSIPVSRSNKEALVKRLKLF